MTEHSIVYHPCASSTLLKAPALFLDKLNVLDQIGACWERSAQSASLPTPYGKPSIRAFGDSDAESVTDMHDWTSLDNLPQDLRPAQAMQHIIGDFARDVARAGGQSREGHEGCDAIYIRAARMTIALDFAWNRSLQSLSPNGSTGGTARGSLRKKV